MAWTQPGTATAGEVLTAAFWNANVRDNSIMGQPVYLNEAARDAAIPAPSEGMIAYLTAPTIPAATAATTIIPTGITTIYNGSVWVCITPVGGLTNTTQTTASTGFTDLATAGPAVTLVTGTTALVTVSGLITAPTTGNYAIMSFAVSGATTRAAFDSDGIMLQSASGTQQGSFSKVFPLTGLTAGTNTFTTKYRVTAGTGTFEGRGIIVKGIA